MNADQIATFDQTRDVRGHWFHSACYAPFSSMYFDVFGNVTACCQNTGHVLGNVGVRSLESIWHGHEVAELRSALQRHDLSVGCEFCAWQIDDGNFEGMFATSFDRLPVDGTDPSWPSQLEFALSNTCNLECVMCHGEFSSSIRAHRDRLPPLPPVYGDGFFEELRPFLQHLRRARFFGGEPFLARESFRIWDLMIAENLAPACNVTTNGTQYNARVERVLEHLPFNIGVSMDGVTRATVESIRRNASYDTMMENLGRFRRYTTARGTTLSLTYCLMLPNWEEFGDYLLFADDWGCPVFINTVVYPPSLSLYRLPPGELAEIVATLEGRDAEMAAKLTTNRHVWVTELERLRHWLRQVEEREDGAGDGPAGHRYFEAHVEQSDQTARVDTRAVTIRSRR